MHIYSIEKLDIIIIENVFNQNEQNLIWIELDNYLQKNIFRGPEETGSATNPDGSLKKKNSSMFLDALYTQNGRLVSSILQITEKKLLSFETKKMLQEKNNIFGMLKAANSHTTLLNYYENSDYYDFHDDSSAFSILTYIFKEPKKFSGGDMIFKQKEDGEEVNIKIKNNMSIFFPSFYQHKVIPIDMKKEHQGKNFGRFSIAQFIGINVY